MPTLKRTAGGGYSARKRIPDDVRADYKRLYGQGYEVKLSIPPGGSEAAAKRHYCEWLAEHEGRAEAIRAAQRGEGIELTPKEAAGLAGQWYSWWVARHEDAPGDPKRWKLQQWQLLDALKEHLSDQLLDRYREETEHDVSEWMLDPDVSAGMRPVLADLGHTAQFLAARKQVLTNKAQELFLDCVLENYYAALLLLEMRAKRGYAPDELPQTFPEFKPSKPKNATGYTVQALFDAWVEARQPAQSTVESWRTVFNALGRKFPDRSVDEITPEKAQDWIDGLKTEQRSAFTVRNTWVRALGTVYRWGVRRKVIGINPFAEVTVDVPRRKQQRPKSFYEHECRTILRAASSIADTRQPIDAARRWVPWLLAYSGARPSEITQLRGQDVQHVDGVWTINLSPEAGTIKGGQARRVPLHAHMIEQGFLQFVNDKGDGPLFYEPRPVQRANSNPTKQKKPPAAQVRQRLATWVREIGVNAAGLSPNHGWRHTFKQLATRAELPEKVVDYICGHAPATEGRGYGAPTLKDMAKAIDKFPRYETEDALAL